MNLTKYHFESEIPFATTLINGKKRIIVKLSERGENSVGSSHRETAFSLLVHEAFHACDQSHEHWNKSDKGGSEVDRFSQKTEECSPRKYRAYTRYYLEEALREETNSAAYKISLQKAVWWNKKYKEDFPEEFRVANVTDIKEGSAEFVTIRAQALLETGCQAGEEELQKAYSEHYLKSRGRDMKVLPTPDLESYLIGSLASALLEKSSSPEWQKRVDGGASPIQLLLDDISPLKSTEIPDIEAGCRSFENMAKYREFSVKNINDQLESENYVALSITYTKETQKSTYFTRGGANLETQGYDQALLDVNTRIDTGSSHITFKSVHLLRPKQSVNQCGDNQRVLLIPKEALSVKGNTSVSAVNFSVERDILNNSTGQKMKFNSSLQGEVTITEKIEQEGADIWCAK